MGLRFCFRTIMKISIISTTKFKMEKLNGKTLQVGANESDGHSGEAGS